MAGDEAGEWATRRVGGQGGKLSKLIRMPFLLRFELDHKAVVDGGGGLSHIAQVNLCLLLDFSSEPLGIIVGETSHAMT